MNDNRFDKLRFVASREFFRIRGSCFLNLTVSFAMRKIISMN